VNKSYIVIPLAIAVGFLIFPFVIYHGSEIMVVTSDSMLPTLKQYDLIIVEQVSIDKVQEGEIIAFDSHIEGIGIIAHRAFEISEANGKLGIDTKGDNVDEPDHWTVYEDDLVGRMTDVVPSMGILFVDPIRYSLFAVIVITSISLLKESMPKKKQDVWDNALYCWLAQNKTSYHFAPEERLKLVGLRKNPWRLDLMENV